MKEQGWRPWSIEISNVSESGSRADNFDRHQNWYRQDLFEQGQVFVAVPPLYKVELSGSGLKKKQKEPLWCYDEDQLHELISGLPKSVSYTLQRFKGLGEMMPEQLWETTLNPATRQLRRMTVDDAAAASHVFGLLMGDKVAPRRALIESEGYRFNQSNLDI
eukprot:gene11061-18668_t